VQFSYAIQKGLNVLMEKPVTADGPTSRKMFELGERATAKDLKVGVGLRKVPTRTSGTTSSMLSETTSLATRSSGASRPAW
jgi:hypothetical protein